MSKISQVQRCKVRPFRAGDERLAKYPPTDPVIGKAFGIISEKRPSITVLLDGALLFCAGFAPQQPGCTEAWVSPGSLAEARPLLFHRIVKQLLDENAAELGLWRIQVVSLSENEPLQRWLRLLGFICEGPWQGGSESYIKIYLERVPVVHQEVA